MQVVRVKPDRSVRNVQGNVFANAMHDLYQVYYKRLNLTLSLPWSGIRYAEPVRFWYIADMTFESVKFYLAAPVGEHFTYMHHRLNRYWPKATFESGIFPAIPTANTDVIELGLEKHNVFALDTDRSEDTVPTADILSVHEDFREGDRAVIAYCFEPYDRVAWADIADKAYADIAAGKVPKRNSISVRANPTKPLEKLNDQLYELHDLLFSGGSTADEARKRDRERNKMAIKSADHITLTQHTNLTTSTRNKRVQPCFKGLMRVCITSTDENRRKVLLRSFANAYAGLHGDNSLKAKKATIGSLAEINDLHLTARSTLPFDVSVYSSNEVGKLIQLPTAALQDQYADILESINKPEIDVPDWMKDEGIPLGDVTVKGKTSRVYIQTKDHDTFCLPHFGFGPQGVGKTLGMGVNTAVGAIEAGYSAFVIDVADGDLVSESRDAMPEWLPDDHIIDLDFGHKQYAIPATWSELAFAGESGDEDDAAAAGNRLASQLVTFIDTIAKSATTDRMSMYLKDAGKARLGRPDATPLDAMLMLTSKKYWDTHKRYVTSARTKAKLEAFWKSGSDADRQNIIRPIQTRISLLIDEERIADHTLQPDTTDERGNPLVSFRKWADGDEHPYFVGIRIPKDFFLETGTDALATFIISKLWLSILSRYDTPKNQRRPCVFIMDEPHQFPSALELYRSVVRESRKWRLKLMWLGHTLEDFKDIIEQVRAAGCQYSQYKAKSEASLRMVLAEMAPFTKEELINLPDRHWAVNRITAPGGQEPAPAFLAHMAAPPKAVKDRSYLRDQWARTLGRPRMAVRRMIADKEAQYL